VIAFGGVLLWAFVRWQRRREHHGQDPLVHLDLLKIPPLRSGLIGMLSQNLILMGIFFSIPLYLQIVLGFDALETGIKMLPVSITMFITSALGSRLSARFSVRSIVRAGLWTSLVAAVVLLATIQPTLAEAGFKAGMAILGVGMGLIVSQLGNVVQSSVDASGRGEAGGLQYTGQQLGSSLGVALIGSIVLIGLGSAFVANIQDDPAIADDLEAQIEAAVDEGIDFIRSDQVETVMQDAGVDEATTAVIVEDYEDASLKALKVGLLAAAFLALFSLAFTRDLPHGPPGQRPDDDEHDLEATTA
jgi:Na+/melibiose symporter-like transporter